MMLPDEPDDTLIEILGIPNFRCSPVAHVMQAAGADIPRKAEREQAAVLWRLLQLYAEHGPTEMWDRFNIWMSEQRALAKERAQP